MQFHRHRDWTSGEEVAHAASHGVGIVLAIGGLVALVGAASVHGDVWRVVGAAVYGATLVLLYGASTLYHAVRPPRAKRLLRVLDHSAIYLLIAGTYTPFAIGPLRGSVGWALFGLVWTGAVAGIVFKCLAVERAPVVSTAIYALLGWSIVVALGPLVAAVGAAGVALLVGGGLCYTGGLVFYAWKQLRWHHLAWHLCVLAGSVFHYFAVLFGVVLPAR